MRRNDGHLPVLLLTRPRAADGEIARSGKVWMRVLIIEDEIKMAMLLKKGLAEEDHCVTLACDGREALEIARLYQFDVIVLDVMLPGIDGLQLAHRLRDGGNYTPILMLTARDTVPDIVKGLDSGADDYLTKPFSFVEFLARLRAVARRGHLPRPVRMEVGDLVLDPARHEVNRAGRPIHLTPTEFRLLECLMRRAGKAVERNALIEAVWGFDQDIENNTLDAFVSLLRGKVDRGHETKLLHTVRGIGFCLSENPTE